ncbi:MAG: hypothetical protein LBM99_05250 [Bacillales bacterium]|jgi:uridine kinase|nr:hypothetical protein [Bacillales bacterium]
MKITVKDVVKEYDKPIRALDLPEFNKGKNVACKINNRLRELTYIINKDSVVEFLELDNYEAMLIYENSLRFLICKAMHNLYPEVTLEFNYFISQAISFSLNGYTKFIDQVLIDELTKEIDKIITADYLFKKRTVSIEEAMKIFDANGYSDKKEVTKYRPEDTAHFYDCDDYINYMFGYMVPSTSYISKYKLTLYYPLIVVSFPRYELKGKIAPFVDSPNFSKTLRESNKWAKMLGASTIADINKQTENVETAIDFISMCETRHNDMLCELGDKILKDISNIKLICIAGPSSSGKTTFSNRLRVALLTRGIKPIRISIDNYYLPRSEVPLDEEGKPDFEHIEALDINLFNEQILALIQGQEVSLPIFNFKKGCREWSPNIKIEGNQPIILEGIHALNDRLTSLIPKYQKFYIYICPLPQFHIDAQNPVIYTDLRLIRRMVRDYKHRNSSAKDTLSMWNSVRKGEFKWIYPCQEGADYTFNSDLGYEFCVLRKYALPLLNEIDQDDEYYTTANRLIKFLKYFRDIDERLVPSNSLAREFIGGSMFEDLK